MKRASTGGTVELFRADGAPYGISLVPPRKRNPSYLLRVTGTGPDDTVVSTRTDFDAAWTRAVNLRLAFIGREADAELRQRLLQAKDAFMALYGIKLRPHTVMQIAEVAGAPV